MMANTMTGFEEMNIMKKEITEARRVALNFFEWLVDFEYRDVEDFEEDIDEMVEDFEVIQKTAPRLFNLLRDISDR